MATLNFTIDEAMNIFNANARLPESIRNIRADGDGLVVNVSGGIAIQLRQESFAHGILILTFGSKNWAFKFADSMGQVDGMIDKALHNLPFIRRQGKSIAIDIHRALQGYIQGVQVKRFELRAGSLRIEF